MMIVTMIMSYKEDEGDNSGMTKKVTMVIPEHPYKNCTGHQIGSTQNQAPGSVGGNEKYWASSQYNQHKIESSWTQAKISFKHYDSSGSTKFH